MIWDFQDSLSRRLILWSMLSIGAGIGLLVFGGTFWRGCGVQALAWGVIDAAIALFGQLSTRRRRDAGLHGPEVVEREARNLRWLLWLNTGLDVLYVTVGLVLVYTLGAQDPFMAGNGWGIMVQGSFLFFFDLLHASTAPRSNTALPTFKLFSGAEHAAFRLNGGKPAALLVHGFSGTPAEMRSLAEALHRQGWTTEALLLPGFGADIATLTERRHTEWLAAVEAAGRELTAAGHQPMLLVGYSLGAALALVAAKTIRPAGLIVLAPFWWPEKWWMWIIEFFVRPFLPSGFRPLRKANLADPKLRQGIAKFMPGLNLDDPSTQAALRDFRMPLGLIDQVRGLSRRMQAGVPEIVAPTLVVQGTRDRLVSAAQTRRLLGRFTNGATYVEVEAAHDLTLPENPAWPAVEAAIIEFALGIYPTPNIQQPT